MVLAETAFCVNSLKYYILYLILYRMISFVIPSLHQVVTLVNRRTYISTATSRQSTDVFCGEDFVSAVEIEGKFSVNNYADLIKFGADSAVVILQGI